MAQKTWIARKGEDADFAAVTVSALTINGVGVTTDAVTLGDGVYITLGDSADVTLNWDGAKLELESLAVASTFNVGAAGHVFNITQHGALTIGVDDTGYDVKLFGATTGCSLLWDESEDQLVITGPADVPALKIAGAGSKSAAAFGTAAAASQDNCFQSMSEVNSFYDRIRVRTE